MHRRTDNSLLRDVDEVLLAPDNVRNRLLDHYVKTGELDISYAHGTSPSPTLERNATLLTYYSAALAGGMMPPEWVLFASFTDATVDARGGNGGTRTDSNNTTDQV